MDAKDDMGSECVDMERLRPLIGVVGGYVYSVTVPVRRLPPDYTARVVPFREGVVVPLEIGEIAWQR